MSSLRGGGSLGHSRGARSDLLNLEVDGMKNPKPRKPRPLSQRDFAPLSGAVKPNGVALALTKNGIEIGVKLKPIGCRALADFLLKAADYLEAKEGMK